jgi:hypothetical protein
VGLRPIQPYTDRVPGALSPGVKRRGVKLITRFRLVSKSRMVELYLHSPICVHGVVCKHRDNVTVCYNLIITK